MWVPFYILLIFFRIINNDQAILQVLCQGTLFSKTICFLMIPYNNLKTLATSHEAHRPLWASAGSPMGKILILGLLSRRTAGPRHWTSSAQGPNCFFLYKPLLLLVLGIKLQAEWDSKLIYSRTWASSKKIWGKSVGNNLVNQPSTWCPTGKKKECHYNISFIWKFSLI